MFMENCCGIFTSVCHSTLKILSIHNHASDIVALVSDAIFQTIRVILPFLFPPLIARMIEKSRVDLDANKLTKIPMIICFNMLNIGYFLYLFIWGLYSQFTNIFVLGSIWNNFIHMQHDHSYACCQPNLQFIH